MATDPPCPCGLPRRLSLCCGRWHAGPLQLQAPDAEALMRSRYCAYARGLVGYLLATWHPRTRPTGLDLPAGQRWLGLQVLAHQRLGDDRASVAFIARSKLNGKAQQLQETSRFLREDGRWYYLDGDIAD